jgi:hypothetical protein
VPLGVGDLLDRVATEPAHVRHLSVGQLAACSLLVKVNTLSQTNPQLGCSFLPVSGYWGYPGTGVLTAAPGDAGRVLRFALAGLCTPGCHDGQSWGLPSADTLLLIERDGGSSGLLDVCHSHIICDATRGYATRLVQRRRSTRVGRAFRARDLLATRRAASHRFHAPCLLGQVRCTGDAR